MKQVTEYWVSPLDEYGDSLEVYYCSNRKEAVSEKELRAEDHPDAVEWRLEKVVRNYYPDGEIKSETIKELK